MTFRLRVSLYPPWRHTNRSNAMGTDNLLRKPQHPFCKLSTLTGKANRRAHCSRCQFRNQHGYSNSRLRICPGRCSRSRSMTCTRCCSCSSGLGSSIGALQPISYKMLVSYALSAKKSSHLQTQIRNIQEKLTRTVRISSELYLKVLFDPCVLFLIVQDKRAEVRLSSDWRFFDIEAQGALELFGREVSVVRIAGIIFEGAFRNAL
jgi:hypothetical protein